MAPNRSAPRYPHGVSAPVVAIDRPGRYHDALEAAADALREGGTVVLPTDTVYGVAALPRVPHATDELFGLKRRRRSQPLAVLVADVAQVRDLIDDPPTQVERWMHDHWPGPLTLVLCRSPQARRLALGGDPDTIGLRCPDSDFVRDLARMVGPIATTSANPSGEATPEAALDAAESLAGEVTLVVDGGPVGGVASTVVDGTAEPPLLLRRGPVTADDLGLPD